MQWPKDTKEVIKRKRTNNDLQNITQKTKDGARRIPKKGGFNSSAPERLAVPVPYVNPFIILLSETNTI